MRVVMVSHDGPSEARGMVPLAWALQTAGHEVRFATQPRMVDMVAGAGLTVVPVGEDHRLLEFLQRMSELPPEGGPQLEMLSSSSQRLSWEAMVRGYRFVVPWWWGLVNEPMMADLVRYCRQWRPDLVVWEAVSFAGAVAAEACGAAHARFVWSVDLFARMRDHFLAANAERPPQEREDPVAEWLGPRAWAFGVDFTEEMIRGQLSIVQMPESLRLPSEDFSGTPPEYVPVRFVPYNGRSVVPEWLREPPERPRVCLTLGAAGLQGFGAFTVPVPDLLEALGGLDVEVVATLPEQDQAGLGPVPANTRLVSFVPLNVLAPTCAAVVNHGGPGTLATIMVHGVPQLVVPTLMDAPMLADLLAASGAGLTVTGDAATPDAVRDQVVRLLQDETIAKAAQRLRDEARAMPSPNDVVGRLERLASEAGSAQSGGS